MKIQETIDQWVDRSELDKANARIKSLEASARLSTDLISRLRVASTYHSESYQLVPTDLIDECDAFKFPTLPAL